MSRIKVTSVIEKILEGSFGNGAVVKNNFASIKSDEATAFVADYCLMDSWVLDSVQGPAFAENILRVIDSTVGAANVTFIHVQAYKKENLPGDQPNPLRFEVVWGGNSLGTMSQFQVANCVISPADIIIRGVAVPANSEGIVSVVVGFNKD